MNALKKIAEVEGYVSVSDGIACFEDGSSLDIRKALDEQEELLSALKGILKSFNPYCIPETNRALKAIKEFTGFAWDCAEACSATEVRS